ncbi:MAG: hypothetical protein PHW33_04760 [Candidatus Portnoybacteria bacterium]|nr:hypothetical protein [Candidatus Portnoybacteria bacterium]
MTKKNKITFRRHPRQTGLAGVGNPNQSVDIKLDNKQIGYIDAPNWDTKDGKWGIQLAIVKDDKHDDGNASCSWMWIFFKKRFDNENEARNWFVDNFEHFRKTYSIYSFED